MCVECERHTPPNQQMLWESFQSLSSMSLCVQVKLSKPVGLQVPSKLRSLWFAKSYPLDEMVIDPMPESTSNTSFSTVRKKIPTDPNPENSFSFKSSWNLVVLWLFHVDEQNWAVLCVTDGMFLQWRQIEPREVVQGLGPKQRWGARCERNIPGC